MRVLPSVLIFYCLALSLPLQAEDLSSEPVAVEASDDAEKADQEQEVVNKNLLNKQEKVDASRLWLPKKYKHEKNKLTSAAVEALRTERCMQVVAGRMDVSKNTPSDYYFIITCRNELRRSYNISYKAPVVGGLAILVNEQEFKLPEPVVVEEEIPGLTGDEAWPICLQALKLKTKSMIEPLFVEENPDPGAGKQAQHEYSVPLRARDPRGNALRYQASCVVDVDGGVVAKIGIWRPK